MTKIKLCGLSRGCDIQWANELAVDYIGFVFAPSSRRYVDSGTAKKLKEELDPSIRAVGVFVNEDPLRVAELLGDGIIDIAQLHGNEDDEYISRLRSLTDRPLIRAFRVSGREDLEAAMRCPADHVLLDNGRGGTGEAFDWDIISDFPRPYFLAGGLGEDNAAEAVEKLRPWAVDVSSGIETDGLKDRDKMRRFVLAVRAASERIGKNEQ